MTKAIKVERHQQTVQQGASAYGVAAVSSLGMWRLVIPRIMLPALSVWGLLTALGLYQYTWIGAMLTITLLLGVALVGRVNGVSGTDSEAQTMRWRGVAGVCASCAFGGAAWWLAAAEPTTTDATAVILAVVIALPVATGSLSIVKTCFALESLAAVPGQLAAHQAPGATLPLLIEQDGAAPYESTHQSAPSKALEDEDYNRPDWFSTPTSPTEQTP